MVKIVLLLSFCIVITPMFAQTEKPKVPGKIFFSSYLGLAKAKGNLSNHIASGFQAMTGAEYKFNKHYHLNCSLISVFLHFGQSVCPKKFFFTIPGM